MKYWINVAARDHVRGGMAKGYTQANHGKSHTLKKLKTGDWIIFYSPQTLFKDGEPLQAFTAIAQVADEDLYQVQLSPEFAPYRRNVTSHECSEVPIRPLIDDLEFITDKTHWGFKFRMGMFEISQNDFELIRKNMMS